MFVKLSVLVALCAPLISALSVDTPSNVTSSSPITINWTYDPAKDKPTFSIELRNEIFHNQFAIANNVNAALQSMTLTLPSVPGGDGYQIDLVDIGNDGNIFSQSSLFTIADLPTSSQTGTSSVSISSATSIGTLSSINPTLPATTANSPAASQPAATGTTTSSASAGSSSSFNSGAVALGVSGSNVASYGLMLVAALAGAGFVGF